MKIEYTPKYCNIEPRQGYLTFYWAKKFRVICNDPKRYSNVTGNLLWTVSDQYLTLQ